ncbi:MAG: hypothetical protein Tsb0017_21210 [Geothermobacteraceae bacterium]
MAFQATIGKKALTGAEGGRQTVTQLAAHLGRSLLWHLLPLALMLLLTSWAALEAGQWIDQARQPREAVTTAIMLR